MSYQFPVENVVSKQGGPLGHGRGHGHRPALTPGIETQVRLETSSSSIQIQNPMLQFALESAREVVLQSGDTVIQTGKRSQSIHTPDLRFDLSDQAFGIIAVASSALPAACDSLWGKVQKFFGRAPKSDATLYSLSIFPPGQGAAPAVLAFVVSNKSEYPEFLKEVFRTSAGIRMAIGTLLSAAHCNNPVVLDIAEHLRENTFGPAARASAMLPANYPWSDIAPQVKEASLSRFSLFDVSTADGVYRLTEAVKRASIAPVRRAA